MKSKKAKRHSYTAIMKELRAAGSAQTRKTYARHGVTGDMFGVSYATLKAMDKRVADDTDLAVRLWDSGNLDARVFACWIVEEKDITLKLLAKWGREVHTRGLGFEVAAMAAYSNYGARQSVKWRRLKKGFRPGMGWGIVANLAPQVGRSRAEGGMTDADLLDCLSDIEAQVHTAPNGTRSNMNQALIAIGARASVSKRALAVAKRVGRVEIDQGNTSCKTLVAYDRIRKTLDHYATRGKTPSDGTAGQRRRHC
jgi:hypothetical protein